MSDGECEEWVKAKSNCMIFVGSAETHKLARIQKEAIKAN